MTNDRREADGRVAVVSVVRNAAAGLRTALSSVMAQTRPPDEVIIVVGPSSDGTREVAAKLAANIRGGKMLDNPAGDRASGLNLALAVVDAGTVALVDAQVLLDNRYLENGLGALAESGAGVVGGPMKAVGRSVVSRAIAAALGSRVGIGNRRFVTGGDAGPVDAVNLGIYRRSTFAAVGGFNTGLLRTEDDDMFARMRAGGIAIWFDPSIQSIYFCRDSIPQLARQFFGYGYWKVALATIRRNALVPRHLAPAALIMLVLSSALTSWVRWRPAVLTTMIPYMLVLTAAGMRSVHLRWRERSLTPIVIATMHISYGMGTILGVVQWKKLRALAVSGAAQALKLKAPDAPASPR